MTLSHILPVNPLEQRLIKSTTPQETKAVEEMSAAARAYAKEQGDYEMMVTATRIYLLARRKTTELILPEIQHGGQGNNRVTLLDYGFTKMQWNRRVKELQVEQEKVNTYFDNCIAKGWNPSIAGVLKFADGEHTLDVDFFVNDCDHILRRIETMLSDNYEYSTRLSKKLRTAYQAVREAMK